MQCKNIGHTWETLHFWNKDPHGGIIEHNHWNDASLILHIMPNWDMIGAVCLLCSDSYAYPTGKFLEFFIIKKPKFLPPNVVSIFLFLLTNGAASQTGKRGEIQFPSKPLSSCTVHIIYQDMWKKGWNVSAGLQMQTFNLALKKLNMPITKGRRTRNSPAKCNQAQRPRSKWCFCICVFLFLNRHSSILNYNALMSPLTMASTWL